MTTTISVRDDADVTSNETAWQRLHRIAEARRKQLRLTQAGVQAAGGPSVAWSTKLPHKTEEPGSRHVANLAKLDRVMQWPDGTSMKLLTEDRSRWNAAVLEDEEESLVYGQDRIATFAFMVERRLRALDDSGAELMMRELASAMGLPVIG